jgi:hypothetical protein
MVEIEEKEKTTKDWAITLLPRVMNATLWGFIVGGEVLILSNLAGIGGQFMEAFPIDQTTFSHILFIFVGLEVAIQLLRGTIFPYVLGVARALISMTILVLITNGGVMNVDIQAPPELPLQSGMSIILAMDFRVILGAFLLLSSLRLIKNLLQAVRFLSEKAEEPLTLPSFP